MASLSHTAVLLHDLIILLCSEQQDASSHCGRHIAEQSPACFFPL